MQISWRDKHRGFVSVRYCLAVCVLSILGVAINTAEIEALPSELNPIQIEFDQGLFIRNVVSVDSRIIVFMTISEFHIYRLQDGKKITKLNVVEHGYPDLDDDPDIPIVCNRRMIVIVTKTILYFYKLSEVDYSAEMMRAIPAQSFNPKLMQFGNKIALSPSNSTLAIKTGTNEFHLLDLRDPLRLTARLFKPEIDKGNLEMQKFLFSDHGSCLTILYHDQSMYTVNILNGHVNKMHISLPTDDSFLKYDSVSNHIIALQTSRSHYRLHVINARTGNILGTLDLTNYFPQYRAFNLVETGTNYIGVQSLPPRLAREASIMVFVDIQTLKVYESARVTLDTERLNLINATFEHSNLMMTVIERDSYLCFNFYSYSIPEESFCHKSCSKHCEFTFVPCKQNSTTLISFGAGFAIVLMIHWLTRGCSYMCACCDKKNKTPRKATFFSRLHTVTDKSEITDTSQEVKASSNSKSDDSQNGPTSNPAKDVSEFPSDQPSGANSAPTISMFSR